MINNATQYSEVVCFYATQSLVLQTADWVRKQQGLSLRLVSGRSEVDFATELQSASIVIVDATADPAKAIATLDSAAAHFGHHRVAVYTEREHAGLKRWVQMHGAAMIVGPMSHAEWNAFFSPQPAAGKVHKAPARTAEKFSHRVMPLPATYLMDRLRTVAQRHEQVAYELEEAVAW